MDINHQDRLRGNHLTGPRQNRRARAQRRQPSLAGLGWPGAFAMDAQAVLLNAEAQILTPPESGQENIAQPNATKRVECAALFTL